MENERTENPFEILVFDKYQCPRMNGKVSMEGKKLTIPSIPMRRCDAEQYNANTKDSSVVFVFNEEATEKYKEFEASRLAQKKANKMNKTAGIKEMLADVIDEAVKSKSAKKSDEPSEPTLKELQAKCESYPKKEWQTLKKADLIIYLNNKEAE